MKKIESGQWTKSIVSCIGMMSVVMSTSLIANTDDGSTLSTAKLHDALGLKIRAVQQMALNPVVVEAVRKQNAEKLSAKIVNERDKKWPDSPFHDELKLSLQGSPAGRFLRKRVIQGGSYSEAFLTDNQGANVAVYPLTGDYNQGDEGKWTNSWNNGEGKVFIGELELDDNTGLRAVQVSVPVLDRGTTIGVLVVGVTYEYIETRLK